MGVKIEMDKKLFNSLTIIEQINYFNEKLKEGKILQKFVRN